MRKKYITRMVNGEKLLCLVANVDGRTYERVISFPRRFKSTRERDKCIAQAINTDAERFVCVRDSEPISGLYGITEFDFMTKAEKLRENR